MYDFMSVKKIVAGFGAINALGCEVRKLNAEKVLIVTDKGLTKTGLVENALKILKKEGIKSEIFDEVESNPKDTTIEKGAQYLREVDAEVVIGLGGGSSMDSAKVIAALSSNEGPIEKYYNEPFKNQIKPIITIATTSGTGSEVSADAMVTDTKNKVKMCIAYWSIAATVAITDPLLTISLPPRLTAETGMDALVHAIEAYVSKSASPFGDAAAFHAIKLIMGSIRKAYADGSNLEARNDMMVGSTLAGKAMANAGAGIVHSLGQSIGGLYDVPHGLTMSVCLPVSMEYNWMANPEKFAYIAKLMGKNTTGLSLIDAAKLSVDATRELLYDLNIAEDIKSMGVTEKSFTVLVDKAMESGCTCTNPRSINKEGFNQLYLKLYNK